MQTQSGVSCTAAVSASVAPLSTVMCCLSHTKFELLYGFAPAYGASSSIKYIFMDNDWSIQCSASGANQGSQLCPYAWAAGSLPGCPLVLAGALGGHFSHWVPDQAPRYVVIHLLVIVHVFTDMTCCS